MACSGLDSGVALSWSEIYVLQDWSTSETVATLGYVGFQLGAAISRFLSDWLLTHFSRRALVMYGCFGAAIGTLTSALACLTPTDGTLVVTHSMPSVCDIQKNLWKVLRLRRQKQMMSDLLLLLSPRSPENHPKRNFPKPNQFLMTYVLKKFWNTSNISKISLKHNWKRFMRSSEITKSIFRE